MISAHVAVRAHPGSKVARVEVREGVVHVYFAEQAEDGKANAALVAMLAKKLDVANARVRIVRGHTSRQKVVGVAGLSEAEVLRRLVC